mgnify:FL=1
MDVLARFSERLKELMADNGLNTLSLEKATGCTNSNISKWLHCKKAPTLNSLIILSDFFECSLDYLTGRSDDMSRGTITNVSTFKDRLTALIQSSGKTVFRISKEIPIPNSQLYKFLKGQTPTLLTLYRIAEYFDCSIDYLAGR